MFETHVRRWRVERDSKDATDRRRAGRCSDRTRERIYLHMGMRDRPVCSSRLHRYFSSMFPRHSNAKAICMANRRIEHVRFLKPDLSSIHPSIPARLLTHRRYSAASSMSDQRWVSPESTVDICSLFSRIFCEGGEECRRCRSFSPEHCPPSRRRTR